MVSYSAKTFWRDKLSANGKRSYDSILAAIVSGQDSCRVYCDYNVNSGFGDIYQAVRYDNPQYFWLNGKSSWQRSGNETTFLFKEPIYVSAQIQSIKRECERIAMSIRGNTPLEKELKIAEYIGKNSVYDIDNTYNSNMASVLHFGRAQCAGVAMATKYLCDKNGVWCIVATGKLDGGPHAWNIVNINGKYYHLEVTGLVGNNNDTSKEFSFYECVNFSDSQAIRKYTWDRTKFPACPESLCLSPEQQRLMYSGKEVFTDMAKFRAAVSNVVKNRQREYTFVTLVGKTQEERQDIVMQNVRAAVSQFRFGMGWNVSISDTLCTVTFNY